MTPSKIERAEGGDVTPPRWARKQACEQVGKSIDYYAVDWAEPHTCFDMAMVAFATHIADREEEPVDPLLIEAREICAADYRIRYPNVGDGTWPDHCINGAYDSDAEVQLTLAGLRRGIELAREQGA